MTTLPHRQSYWRSLWEHRGLLWVMLSAVTVVENLVHDHDPTQAGLWFIIGWLFLICYVHRNCCSH